MCRNQAQGNICSNVQLSTAHILTPLWFPWHRAAALQSQETFYLSMFLSVLWISQCLEVYSENSLIIQLIHYLNMCSII